jgi:radical SAM superfamily enzyme YgiQ (UPF0313 family)
MFLLRSLVPPGHHVHLVDANATPLTEDGLARFVREHDIGLVGIGFMTRMAAKAFRMALAARAAGAKVVMGGPHVTEMPDEALGRDGGPRYADAIALGEADQTWPQIVLDAARGELKEVYAPVDAQGAEQKPSLSDYPPIRWDQIDLEQFNLINLMPAGVRRVLERFGMHWKCFHIVPIESGRGCPYGCEFCTVTGFFGDSIRFRTNESVVEELLLIKRVEKERQGKIAVFFIDDNFAINIKRTKSLLRDIISAGAEVPWVAQISINLLRDIELLDLIRDSGGKWIFCGLESIDDDNLKSVAKGFNKPAEYRGVLERMAERRIYAITSFIFGMDGDRPGTADRVLDTVRTWPPGLPVYGLLTPYPGTPLYDKLAAAGRLTRPRHWMEFKPFHMAFDPAGMNAEAARQEVARAWTSSYAAAETARAIDWLAGKPLPDRLLHLFARLAFRGIYFPQMHWKEWAGVVIDNRGTIARLLGEAGALQLKRVFRGAGARRALATAPSTAVTPDRG